MKTTRSLATILVFGTALGLATATASPAAAASVRVTPTSGLTASGATVTVSGSGFSATANGGVGIYVVFGPKKANFHQDANVFGAARWVHPKGAGGGPGQAALSQDGSFSTTLSVKAQYTDGNGTKVDCLKTQCYVLTFAAHGSADRSQDTATPVTFKQAASTGNGNGSPAASPSASKAPSTGAPPSAAAAPAASASPGAAKTAEAANGAPPVGAPEVAPEEVEAQTVSSSDTVPAWPFWTSVAAVLAIGFAARAFTRRRLARR
jgi:hypothetical protein